MARKDDELHTELGHEHARLGMPRYKYQDHRLQGLYNKGYDSYKSFNDDEPQEVWSRNSCASCGRTIVNTTSRYCTRCRI